MVRALRAATVEISWTTAGQSPVLIGALPAEEAIGIVLHSLDRIFRQS